MNDVVSQIVVKRQYLLELSLAGSTIAQGTSVNWKNNQFLSKPNVFVYGIEVCTAAELAVSPTGRTVIPAVDGPNILVNIVSTQGNLNFAQNYPATRLRPALYNGYTQYFLPRPLDLDRSNITLVAAGTITNSMSVCLNIFYKIIEKGKEVL